MWYTVVTFPGICGTRFFRVPHHEKSECIILKIFYLWQEYHRSRLFSTAAKKASAINPGTVEIEVSYNRERVRLSPPASLSSNSSGAAREVVNHPQADHLNERMRPCL